MIFTENLGHSNITPYLYMSQIKEGVLVGDQKQQDFMAAIESCNFVSVKQLLRETPILISLFAEQLRYNESPRMGNTILSAIDCTIKDKGLGRKMRGKLDESELKEYRSYLS